MTDKEDSPAPPPKKRKCRSKKQATVIGSDESSSDEQVTIPKKLTKTNLAPSLDSDIQEVKNPKETPEEELGEL